MISLSNFLIILSLILFSIWYMIKEYKQQAIIKKQKENKQQEIKQQEIKQEIKIHVFLKQQEENTPPAEIYYNKEYDNILLLIFLDCFDNKMDSLNRIIKKNINKYKHTLDKQNEYEFNDIFNGASIDKEIDFIKLIFTLDNIKNKKYLSDNIFIDREETVNELLEYAIKNNMYELCDFVLDSKSFKLYDDNYIELEKTINNKEMYLLLMKYKIQDIYRN